MPLEQGAVRQEARATVMLGALVRWLRGWQQGHDGWQEKWQSAARCLLLLEWTLLAVAALHVIYPVF